MGKTEIKGKQRIEWIDELKGLGIILVLLGHVLFVNDSTVLPLAFKMFIYSFHMPLFFFLSGYVFSEKGNYGEFAIKKVKTILMPMLFFSIINIIITLFVKKFIRREVFNLSAYILNSFIASLLNMEFKGFQPPLWFLQCLFVLEILFGMIVRVSKSNLKLIITLTVLLYLAGCCLIQFDNIVLPFTIKSALIAVIYFLIGYCCKKTNLKLDKKYHKYLIPILLMVSVTLVYVKYKVWGYVEGYTWDTKNCLVIQLICSFSMIAILVMVASRIKRISILSYIGKNSLIYYALGDCLMFIPDILLYNILRVNVNSLGNTSVIASLFLVCADCCLLYIASKIINKYFPWMIGKVG